MKLLSGWKTFAAGGAAIIVGILSQIFSWFDTQFNTGLILSGFALIGVGHKIDKVTPPTPPVQ